MTRHSPRSLQSGSPGQSIASQYSPLRPSSQMHCMFSSEMPSDGSGDTSSRRPRSSVSRSSALATYPNSWYASPRPISTRPPSAERRLRTGAGRVALPASDVDVVVLVVVVVPVAFAAADVVLPGAERASGVQMNVVLTEAPASSTYKPCEASKVTLTPRTSKYSLPLMVCVAEASAVRLQPRGSGPSQTEQLAPLQYCAHWLQSWPTMFSLKHSHSGRKPKYHTHSPCPEHRGVPGHS